jgi:predicted nucleotidyltransferase
MIKLCQENPVCKNSETLREQRPGLAEQYNVATLEIFGSHVRHEENKNSDLDILVTFSKTPSLLKFIRLEYQLSDSLGIKVDLVMKDSLKPVLGKNILREVVPV